MLASMCSIAAEPLVVTPALSTYITHGPLLGKLESRSIGIWARTNRPGSFYVQFGTDPDQLTSRTKGVKTVLVRDNTNWIQIEALQPDTRYYYRIVANDSTFATGYDGSFHTLPEAGQYRGPRNPDGVFNFSFSATSCAKLSPTLSQGLKPRQTMFEHFAGRVNFGIELGDWIYERDRDLSVSEWHEDAADHGTEVPELVLLAPNLPGVWQNYKSYLKHNHFLNRWHGNIPSLFLFDDHELLNNFSDATLPGLVRRDSLFRDPALQGWHDYLGWSNPGVDRSKIYFGRLRMNAGSKLVIDEKADFSKLEGGEVLHVHWGGPYAGYRNNDVENRKAISEAINRAGPQNPNAGIYKIERIIDKHTAEVSPPPSSDSETPYSINSDRYYFHYQVSNAEFIGLDTRSERRSSLVSESPTLLGETQKSWLMKRLSESDAEVIFILSSVSFTIPHTSTTPLGSDDQSWTGYPEERQELIKGFKKTGKQVIILSGDLHNAFSIQLADNIWEFSVGPIGSFNRAIGRADKKGIVANGPVARVAPDAFIRWSTHYLKDTPSSYRRTPVYAVIQINNVFNSPDPDGADRWIAYSVPQAVIQFYNATEGSLLYAESVLIGKTDK